MKAGILCKRASWSSVQMQKSLIENGIESKIILLNDNKLDVDYIIVRGGPGIKTKNDWDFLIQKLKKIEDSGIKCINSLKAIENSINKYVAYEVLRKNKIPQPQTFFCETKEDVKQFIKERCLIHVAKPIIGSEGFGIQKIKDEEDVENLEYQPILIQEFLPHGGQDIRAYVVGDEVLGGIMRKAKPGEWITNLAKGATPEKRILSKDEIKVAKNAVRAIGADFATVDMVNINGKIYVLEVNILPVFSIRLVRITGINFIQKIIKYFVEKYIT